MTIQGLAPILPPELRGVDAVVNDPAGEAFHAAFTEAVGQVDGFQKNAQMSVDRFLSGEGEEIHQVALAVKQAELSFDLFLQVRNKVVNAYEEVMRMQV
jgi:flagellar hook-basal body complex protein FliE